MTKIYFVRHGQTDYNVQRREAGGLTEVPLNAAGLQQAEELRKKFDKIKFDVAICSPMGRAKKTFSIINRKRKIPWIIDSRLLERKLGDLEGKVLDSRYYDDIWSYATNTDIPGDGETVEEFSKRIIGFFDSVKDEYSGKTLLIVAHGGVGKVFKAYLYGKPEGGNLNSYALDNCEIIETAI